MQVAYQEVGGTDAGRLPAAGLLVDFATGGTTISLHPLRQDYLRKISFPPAALNGTMASGDQRAYELTVILTAQSKTGKNLGFAAYFDVGVVQVYKP